MLALSSDDSFNYQLVVNMGLATYRGADIGDNLVAAKKIKPADFESFSSTFYDLANRTETEAEAKENNIDFVNVQDTYFAASAYWRSADFYLHGNWSDPRVNDYWDHQTKTFNRALAAMPVPGQRVSIPADGFDIEAIYYSANKPGEIKKLPTIMLGNGYDGSQEELLHWLGFPALERGWNVITYEGPGQPTVRRNQDIGFIREWEKVTTPVVDYLEERNDVDMSTLTLLGFSFGGYLAARAAAFEPRIKALIVDGGVYDVHAAFTDQLPPPLKRLYQSGQKQEFDAQINSLLKSEQTPTQLRWGVEQGLWAFKIPSSFDFLEFTKPMSLKNIADRIQVPTWIASAEFDQFYQGQPEMVKEALGDRATLQRFEGANGLHCQAGAEVSTSHMRTRPQVPFSKTTTGTAQPHYVRLARESVEHGLEHCQLPQHGLGEAQARRIRIRTAAAATAVSSLLPTANMARTNNEHDIGLGVW